MMLNGSRVNPNVTNVKGLVILANNCNSGIRNQQVQFANQVDEEKANVFFACTVATIEEKESMVYRQWLQQPHDST